MGWTSLYFYDIFFPVLWFLLVVGTMLTVKAKVLQKEEHAPDCYMLGIPLLQNRVIKQPASSFLTTMPF